MRTYIKIIAVFAVLLWTPLVSAKMLQAVVVGQPVADGGPVSYDYHETFDSGTEDNTWTDAGGSGVWTSGDTTKNLYNSTGNLHVDSEDRRMSITGTDNAVIVTGIFEATDEYTPSAYVIFLRESDGSAVIGFRLVNYSTDHWTHVEVYDNGDWGAEYAIDIYPDTTYWFKIEYNNGSSSDSVQKIWVVSSAPTSSWGSELVDVGGTTKTEQVGLVALGKKTGNTDVYYDEIRVNLDGTDILY